MRTKLFDSHILNRLAYVALVAALIVLAASFVTGFKHNTINILCFILIVFYATVGGIYKGVRELVTDASVRNDQTLAFIDDCSDQSLLFPSGEIVIADYWETADSFRVKVSNARYRFEAERDMAGYIVQSRMTCELPGTNEVATNAVLKNLAVDTDVMIVADRGELEEFVRRRSEIELGAILKIIFQDNKICIFKNTINQAFGIAFLPGEGDGVYPCRITWVDDVVLHIILCFDKTVF